MMAEMPWRLLVTEPLDGATNMALDEALLLSRIRGAAPPTLRFFSWSPPTVSLGYGQPLDGRVNLEACRRLGIGLVRRPPGGSAIYHDTREREVPYSVAAASGDFEGADDLLETYRWISVGLLAGLRTLGAPAELVPAQPSAPFDPPAFCFARAGSYEIEVKGKKLVGSAQRRRHGAFLQHGSILLGADSERLRLLFPLDGDPLEGMTTLESATGRLPAFEEAVEALTAGISETHAVSIVPGGLLAEEESLMERLVAEKYGRDDWNLRAHAPADLEYAASGRSDPSG